MRSLLTKLENIETTIILQTHLQIQEFNFRIQTVDFSTTSTRCSSHTWNQNVDAYLLRLWHSGFFWMLTVNLWRQDHTLTHHTRKHHVNWRNWRNWGNHYSLDIGPIYLKFCVSFSSPQVVQVCVTFRNDFNFFLLNFQSVRNWRNTRCSWGGKYRVSQKVWRKTTCRRFIQNYSLTRFM
jgi:hypothetical protein